jgi:hypothetical protein
MPAIPDLSKLRRLAHRLRLGIVLGSVGLVVITAFAVLAPAPPNAIVSANLDTGGLPRAWASGSALITVGMLLAALGQLHQMFGLVARGPAFSVAVARRLRRFSQLLATAAATNIILPLLAKAWLSHQSGQPASLSLSLNDLLPLLFAAIFCFVAEAFDQAAAFEIDSKAFV